MQEANFVACIEQGFRRESGTVWSIYQKMINLQIFIDFQMFYHKLIFFLDY